MRWNADWASSAVPGVTKGPAPYNAALCHSVNELSEDVLGQKINPDVHNIGIYTGERILVEYLFSQTGKVRKEDNFEEDAPKTGEEPDVDPEQLDEGFKQTDDETIPSAEQVFIVQIDTVKSQVFSFSSLKQYK